MHGPTAIASRRDVGDHRHVGSVTKMDGLDAGWVPQGQDPPASSGMWQKRCQSLRHHHGTRGGSYDAGSPVLREGWGRGLPPGCCGRQEGGEAQGNNAWLSSQHEGPQPGSVLPGDSRKKMSSSSPPGQPGASVPSPGLTGEGFGAFSAAGGRIYLQGPKPAPQEQRPTFPPLGGVPMG